MAKVFPFPMQRIITRMINHNNQIFSSKMLDCEMPSFILMKWNKPSSLHYFAFQNFHILIFNVTFEMRSKHIDNLVIQKIFGCPFF
jgi:hypothetical protein